MAFTLQAETAPLREDADGALRVGNSRVLLELVIRAFEDGATPETIVLRYSTLDLGDVYAVIGYYLRHRDELQTYLNLRERQGREIRERIEGQQGDMGEIRARVAGRRQVYLNCGQ